MPANAVINGAQLRVRVRSQEHAANTFSVATFRFDYVLLAGTATAFDSGLGFTRVSFAQTGNIATLPTYLGDNGISIVLYCDITCAALPS